MRSRPFSTTVSRHDIAAIWVAFFSLKMPAIPFLTGTAISTPQVADLREGDSGVRLFGVGDGVNAKLEVWELRQANNFEAERDEQA